MREHYNKWDLQGGEFLEIFRNCRSWPCLHRLPPTPGCTRSRTPCARPGWAPSLGPPAPSQSGPTSSTSSPCSPSPWWPGSSPDSPGWSTDPCTCQHQSLICHYLLQHKIRMLRREQMCFMGCCEIYCAYKICVMFYLEFTSGQRQE